MEIDNHIYERMATTWWEDGSLFSTIRHLVHPGRMAYFQEALDKLGLDPRGLRVLDIGCGGGFLSEEFARMGCEVTGIDQSPATIQTAQQHALASGLKINYLPGDAEHLPFEDGSFDLVCCCDVLEHVDRPGRAITEVSRVLRPGGAFFYDTINRTLLSNLVMIKFAQEWRWTRFTDAPVHVWDKFIRPSEIRVLLQANGLLNRDMTGLAPRINPFSLGWAAVRLVTGKINWAEFGRQIRIAKIPLTQVSYMGYAQRAANGEKALTMVG